MKLRSKADVAQYAASIGLDLGEDYKDKALDDLKETVINFQEEMEAGSDDGSTSNEKASKNSLKKILKPHSSIRTNSRKFTNCKEMKFRS